MALKNYKPTSPARRGLILIDKTQLWKGKPVKSLTEGKRKTGGRNNKGHVTSRGIGGGNKQKYRVIDFKRRKWDVPATVERIEYDPNRTAFIALVKYEDGEQAYILCPQRLAVGDTIVAGEKADTKPGNAMLLGQMPVGTICHNVEMKPGKGGQIARSAGAYVQLVGRDRGMVIVRLNSGEQRYLRADCMGTVGAVSNPDNQNQNFGKAGRTRWKGRRPLTR
ncbi:MAG: 50S ribosomal protein L2, partial [Erythrobacter sp.]